MARRNSLDYMMRPSSRQKLLSLSSESVGKETIVLSWQLLFLRNPDLERTNYSVQISVPFAVGPTKKVFPLICRMFLDTHILFRCIAKV